MTSLLMGDWGKDIAFYLEARLKRRSGSDGTYLDGSRQNFSCVPIVTWRSLERFITVDDCRRRIIDLKEARRSYGSVFVNLNPGYDKFSSVSQNGRLCSAQMDAAVQKGNVE